MRGDSGKSVGPIRSVVPETSPNMCLAWWEMRISCPIIFHHAPPMFCYDSYICVTDLKTKVSHRYRLLERIDVEGRPPRRKDARLATSQQEEMFFNGCTLSPEFFGLLGRITELQHLKVPVAYCE